MERLVLIDGHAVLYRAFHALPKSLTNSSGQPVNAVYGFSRMLLKVIKDLKPTHLAVAFDLPGPTFRNQLFADYQATRPKMPDDLSSQIEPIREVVQAFNIPVFEKDGFEADDVLGTLASLARLDTIIITGDKDILQLVDEKTKVCLLQKGINGAELVDQSGVEERLGVKPNQVVAYKALAGDPADNYPGVSGIGPKTAQKLLKQFGSLEKAIAGLDFQEQKAARLSQQLAAIKRDLPLDFDLNQCRLNYDPGKVKQIFAKYRFKSLIKELEKKEEQMKLIWKQL